MTEEERARWHADRSGRITASNFADVLALKKDGKPLAARDKYMRELVFERLAGTHKHSISSKSLAWGTEIEQFAREAYQVDTGNLVTQSPFIVHAKYDFIGASPDGLVDDDPEGPGGTESKCPMDEAVHVETWLKGMPDEHIPQVQGGMFVTGRKWWDFISFDPRCKDTPQMMLYVQRIYRDEVYIATLEAGLLKFEAELRVMIQDVRARMSRMAA